LEKFPRNPSLAFTRDRERAAKPSAKIGQEDNFSLLLSDYANGHAGRLRSLRVPFGGNLLRDSEGGTILYDSDEMRRRAIANFDLTALIASPYAGHALQG
jgi:hypothetical protein